MRTLPTLRTAALGVVLLLFAATSTSCAVHRHTVGLGPGGYGEETTRQYYLLWGLWPLNDTDAQRMAGNAAGYEVVTYWGFVDFLMSPFLFPLLTTSRTVTVIK